MRRRTSGPYWAYLWPSARALGTLVGALPDGALAGRRVLDLGTGLGAVALCCASRGARVVAADLVPEALVLCARNAARNGLAIETLRLDWNAPPPDLGTFDGILAADVLYDDGMLRGVLRFIRRHLSGGGLAWIADPMRIPPAGVAGAAS